ncbi:glycoside hydrolase superfamily [Obelidium mucronatum]|nr:glycoside hydrolase superfamily [Obelidium mucronatum]
MLIVYVLLAAAVTATDPFFKIVNANTKQKATASENKSQMSLPDLATAFFASSHVSGAVSISATGTLETMITGLPAYRAISVALTQVGDFSAVKMSSTCEHDASTPTSFLLGEYLADQQGTVNASSSLAVFDVTISSLAGHGVVILQDPAFCPNGVPLAGSPLVVESNLMGKSQRLTFSSIGEFLNAGQDIEGSNGRSNKAEMPHIASVVSEPVGTLLAETKTTSARSSTRSQISSKPSSSVISAPSEASLPSGNVTIPAPRLPTSKKVTYVNQLANSPTAAQFAVPGFADNDYNIINYAFWLDVRGPVDTALSWVRLSESTRQAYVNAFHQAGKRLLISAFGETDAPASAGTDPVDCAKRLAAFVIKYGFDGVDVDFEDHAAFSSGKAEPWLIAFTKELRSLLPSPQYAISHAPQAPLFMESKALFPGGGYLTIDKAVGNDIDWHNIQFYNQGNEGYDSCVTLFTQSTPNTPKTSVFEIASKGIHLSKLVVGKPAAKKGATNTGYMLNADLAACIGHGKELGWKAGVMGWNFELDPNGDWIYDVANCLEEDEVLETESATVSLELAPTETPEPEDTYFDPIYGLLNLSSCKLLFPNFVLLSLIAALFF